MTPQPGQYWIARVPGHDAPVRVRVVSRCRACWRVELPDGRPGILSGFYLLRPADQAEAGHRP